MKVGIKQSIELGIITVLFICSYFYLQESGIDILITLVALGVYTAIVTYFILNSKFGIVTKVVCVCLFSLLLFFLPQIGTETNNGTLGLKGRWLTDSTDGFAIALLIQNDSAFISEVGDPQIAGYKLIANVKRIKLLEGEKTQFHWNYRLVGDSTLFLTDDKATLEFTKISP